MATANVRARASWVDVQEGSDFTIYNCAYAEGETARGGPLASCVRARSRKESALSVQLGVWAVRVVWVVWGVRVCFSAWQCPTGCFRRPMRLAAGGHDAGWRLATRFLTSPPSLTCCALWRG